jgi:hypothetical protein
MLTRLGLRAAQFAWTAVVAGLSFAMFQGPAIPLPDAPAPAKDVTSADVDPTHFQDLTISDPVQYENLTIFLIRGKVRVKPGSLLTVQEAMEQHKAVVHEIEQVSKLQVENVSPDSDVFIQSGDIVKGGKQDRLITFDLLLSPQSGKVAVASRCVEQGRWTQRGKEAAAHFNSSTRQLPTKMLKVYGGNYNGFNNYGFNNAINNGNLNNATNGNNTANNGSSSSNGSNGYSNINNNSNNGNNGCAGLPLNNNFNTNGYNNYNSRGYSNSANFGNSNSNNNSTIRSVTLNNGNNGFNNGQVSEQQGVWQEVGEVQKKLAARLRTEVKSDASGSSLQLTLEHPKVQEAVGEYIQHLAGIVTDQDDVIGYAFAINGRVNSIEVYANAELFKKLWPKLLKANALEAFIEQEDGKDLPSAGTAEVKAVLKDAEEGQVFEKDVSGRVRVILRETEKNVVFETRDRERDTWIHRSYLTK